MRLKLEIIGGVVLLAVAILALWQWNEKQVEVRVATVIAEHDRQADAKADARQKQIDQAAAQLQKDYEAKVANLKTLTPQQIVVKVPEYVPAATAPVTILPPGDPHAGDALVPAADIQPIAKALLDGNKCASDLGSCKESVATWQEKYAAKKDESEHWRVAAKGGSIWKRVGKDILKIGAGVGIGYALSKAR